MRRLKTSHKDKEGNEIPGYPSEDGEQPKKDIPGYRFVERLRSFQMATQNMSTKKLKTSHKDKEGNEIPGYQAKTVNNLRKIFQVTAS